MGTERDHRRKLRSRLNRPTAQGLALRRSDFLKRYGFTEEQFKQTGLEWDMLDQVSERHSGMLTELQNTATYIVERLQTVPAVHALKSRIKDAEHLVAKIISKKCAGLDVAVDCSTYEQCITDLVGVRVLHLFKDDWLQLHDFVIATWELNEEPIAYVRDGDADQLGFADAGCRVATHRFGYRSVHYVIKSQPAKHIRLVELQVRTIFEEGWSEIDHRVRYARRSDDPQLALFLTIFNRLAGSADEMGTFTKILATNIRGQAAYARESARQIQEKEAELKKTISQLQITKEEKISLQKQIAEMNNTTHRFEPGELLNAMASLSSFSQTDLTPTYLQAFDSLGAAAGKVVSFRRCQVCSKDVPVTSLASLASFAASLLCPDCASHKAAGG